jgi:hypothetical protein
MTTTDRLRAMGAETVRVNDRVRSSLRARRDHDYWSGYLRGLSYGIASLLSNRSPDFDTILWVEAYFTDNFGEDKGQTMLTIDEVRKLRLAYRRYEKERYT